MAAAEGAVNVVQGPGHGQRFDSSRPGLMTKYLRADRFRRFRLWKLSIEEGKRLGIEVTIYDENSVDRNGRIREYGGWLRAISHGSPGL